jgi:hypothetical protein
VGDDAARAYVLARELAEPQVTLVAGIAINPIRVEKTLELRELGAWTKEAGGFPIREFSKCRKIQGGGWWGLEEG